VFRAEALLQAYVAAESDNFHGVDTSQTVMRYTDLEVAVIHGDPRNVKVTFAEDLQRADAAASAFDPAR
jgi:2-C-methyl-D-erythritol 4-phosphate cytidylyltransferase